jgi:isopenicillin-N N-acyltransferase like protein
MLPVISVKGKPGEVGYQYGEECREMIQKNVHLYFRLFKHYAQLDRSQAISLARRFIPVVQAFDPAILEEIKGIAEGARFEFEEILALNARTELMYPESLATGGECTSMVALSEATAQGEVLIGQNWDWKPHLIESTVLLEIEQEGRPNVVTLTEAGIVGKIGLNSSGMGACLNILKSPIGLVGVPIHVLMRGILNCERMGDAVRKIVGQDRASSNNCLVAHRDGAAMDFETAPDQWDFIYPEKGIIVHTNHFTSERLKPMDTNVSLYPDTLVRFGRARQKMMAKAGNITVEDFKEVFRDHLNHPNSICRHPDERDPELEHVQTVASIIMNLTRKEVHIASGPPCQNEYQTIKFKALQ